MQIATGNRVVPTLRFGEFEEEWVNYRLGDICNKIQDGNYGGSYPKSDEFVKEGIPFLTSKALGGDGFLKEDKFDFLPIKKHNQLKKAHIELNDVLFTNRGSNVGVISFVDKRIDGGNIGPQLTLLRSNLNIVTPLFLKVSLVTFNFKKQVKSQDSGSAMNFFGIKATSRFKLNLPSLPEQQKIATFLSAVDEKLQQLTKKKSLLVDYKKGVMQQIFSQELRFKDDNGNNYPDWEEKKLGEVGVTFNGLTGKTKEDFGRGKPYIQYMQIFNSAKIDISKFGYVDVKEGEKQKTAKYGDVFFTTSSETPMEIGYASVLTEDTEELYLNSFCFGYRPNSLNELYPDFASYLFRSESLRKQIVKLAQGSTRYNMSKVQLMKVLIQLPSLEEQQKIANFLSSLDSKIDSVSTQIENTKAFKKGLLQQMFV